MTHLLLTWGYAAVLLATALAAMGLPTGSELVIAYAGALSSGHLGSGHHLNLAVVIGVATAGELLGSFLGYAIGRLGGRPLVERVGRYVLVTSRDLDRGEALFARHGEQLVFFGRFVPLLRSFIGLAAGIAEMAIARFAVFTALAAAIWCAGFAVLGDAVGASWERVLRSVSDAGYFVAAALIVSIGVAFVLRFRSVRKDLAAKSEPDGLAVDQVGR